MSTSSSLSSPRLHLRSRVLFPELERRHLTKVETGASSSLDDGGEASSSAIPENEGLHYDIYKSPCAFKASNEEFSPEDIDEFEVCSTTFYGGCLLNEPPTTTATTSSSNADVFELEIGFDFELWRRKRSNPTKTLQHLEPVILEHVASVVGLKDCTDDDDEDGKRYGSNVSNDVDVSNDTDNRRLGTQQQQLELDQQKSSNSHHHQKRRRMDYTNDFSTTELDLIIGVSSKTEDFVDGENDGCAIPVTRSQVEGATCKPSTGVMTIYLKNDPPLTGEQLTSISSRFLRLIRFGMQEGVYVGGNTQHLSFIGTRTDADSFVSFRDAKPIRTPVNLQSEEESKLTAYIISAAGLGIVVLFILFVYIRPRRRKKQQLEHDFLDAVASSFSISNNNRSYDSNEEEGKHSDDDDGRVILDPPSLEEEKCEEEVNQQEKQTGKTWDKVVGTADGNKVGQFEDTIAM